MIAPNPERKPLIYGYGRRSTDQQAMSLDQQESVILKHIELHRAVGKFPEGAEYKEFIGDTFTRAVPFAKRPQGAELALRLQPGDYLYVSNFDRLIGCRQDIDCFEWLVKERRVNVVMLDCGIDTSTDLGMFAVSILALTKDLERKTIGRRTREAHAHRKSKGLPVGQPAIGWKIERKHLGGGKVRTRHIVDTETRLIANYIVDMYDRGKWSFRQITNAINKRGRTDKKWRNPRTITRRGANAGVFSQDAVERFYRAAKAGYPVNNVVHAPGVPDLPDITLAGVGGDNPLP